MQGGLIGHGLTVGRNTPMEMMRRYATLDEKLKSQARQANDALEAQEQQQNMSLGSAAGGLAGAAIGASIGSGFPVVGTAIGAIVGGIAGSMF